MAADSSGDSSAMWVLGLAVGVAAGSSSGFFKCDRQCTDRSVFPTATSNCEGRASQVLLPLRPSSDAPDTGPACWGVYQILFPLDTSASRAAIDD